MAVPVALQLWPKAERQLMCFTLDITILSVAEARFELAIPGL